MSEVVLNEIRRTVRRVAGDEDFVFGKEIHNDKDSITAHSKLAYHHRTGLPGKGNAIQEHPSYN